VETVRSPQARPPPNAAVMDIHSPMDVDRGGSGAPPPNSHCCVEVGNWHPLLPPQKSLKTSNSRVRIEESRSGKEAAAAKPTCVIYSSGATNVPAVRAIGISCGARRRGAGGGREGSAVVGSCSVKFHLFGRSNRTPLRGRFCATSAPNPIHILL